MAILVQKFNVRVRYKQPVWDGTFETVEICYQTREGEEERWQTLAQFKKGLKNVTKFLKKHYVLITRIFDERVKNFVNNIILNHGVASYAYRVEFQVRGMPHIHGVN